jgi:uncharacterized protein (UPF0548 family)
MAANYSLSKPAVAVLNSFLARQAATPFSYADLAWTRDGRTPVGYHKLHHSAMLGRGAACYAAACRAIVQWQMFDLGWVELYPRDAEVKSGTAVAILVRAMGFWWLSAARIVYTIDEQRSAGLLGRFGFAYGTTIDHAERGEERFLVEWRDDDSVWYDLFSFSQPAHWLAKMGSPMTKRLQMRFAADSLRTMQQAVARELSCPH